MMDVRPRPTKASALLLDLRRFHALRRVKRPFDIGHIRRRRLRGFGADRKLVGGLRVAEVSGESPKGLATHVPDQLDDAFSASAPETGAQPRLDDGFYLLARRGRVQRYPSRT